MFLQLYHQMLSEMRPMAKERIIFPVAYTKRVATSWHGRIYLFVHKSRAPVTWSNKPHIYALRTYFYFMLVISLFVFSQP